MTNGSTTAGPPSTTTWTRCFLRCFGCSGEKTPPTDEVNSSRRRHRRRWKSKLTFRFKKPKTKTVPVDLTADHRKPKSEIDAPAKTPVTEENEKMVKSGERNTRRKSKNGGKEGKSATGSGGSSPEQKTVAIAHSCVSSPLKPLTHAKSLPPRKTLKPPRAPPAGGGGGKEVRRRTPPAGGDFDSIIGMSIVLVILLIMVLWGKLCAILCTSAWFFVVRRLVATGGISAVATAEELPPELYNNNNNNNNNNNVELESVEYKKQVVLEGLLQRDHRKVVGRL